MRQGSRLVRRLVRRDRVPVVDNRAVGGMREGMVFARVGMREGMMLGRMRVRGSVALVGRVARHE